MWLFSFYKSSISSKIFIDPVIFSQKTEQLLTHITYLKAKHKSSISVKALSNTIQMKKLLQIICIFDLKETKSMSYGMPIQSQSLGMQLFLKLNFDWANFYFFDDL